jgi:hypothetical protein
MASCTVSSTSPRKGKITVKVGRPVPGDVDGNWGCRLKIAGCGLKHDSVVWGCGSLQALILVGAALRKELRSAKVRGTVDEAFDADWRVVLPAHVPTVFGAGFTRKIESLIGAEVAAIVRRAARRKTRSPIKKPVRRGPIGSGR